MTNMKHPQSKISEDKKKWKLAQCKLSGSNYTFSHHVFERFILQDCQTLAIYGKTAFRWTDKTKRKHKTRCVCET